MTDESGRVLGTDGAVIPGLYAAGSVTALTDDLAMKAVTRYAEEQGQCPAVLAIAAGCDMVVTTDFQTQIPQVLAALEDGTLSRDRVEEAAARVLNWKYDLGLLP